MARWPRKRRINLPFPVRKKRGSRGRLTVEELERRVLLSVSATIPAVVLDPVDRLAGSRILGDWNAAGLDGWTLTNVQSSLVSGGSLTLTSQNATGNPLQIDLRNIASGPNLDYAFFDFLQVRMQLPVAFNKDVTFQFGTSTHTGFASDRTFTISAASLAQDGAMHTYRLDLGLVVWWRDALNDLRIQPLGATGANETMAIDYVEVGDQPNDTLLLNTNLNYAAGVTAATAQHIESKHFAVWWDPAVDPGGRGFDPAVEGLHAIRALEESYQVYYKVLGYDEPFQTLNHTGARNKLNLLTWYGGYWEGGWANYAHMNIDTSGLQDEGVGSPTPHEFGHAIDSNQLGNLAGGHWESHANYLRDQRNLWFAPLFSASTVTSISLNVMTWSNFQQDAHRIIYEDYRIHDALTYYATSLGLPADEAARLWRTGSSGQSAWAKLATLLPVGTSIKDVAGALLRYWPMLDFPTVGTNMKAQLWGSTAAKAEYMWRTGSPLLPQAEDPGWYRVPMERAPEKYAYMYHVLTPSGGAGSSVTVNLRGLNLFSTDEDWRWSLAFTDGNGNVLRYSNVFAPGSQTVTLNAGETQLLLIVVATPTSATLDLDSFYNTAPIDKTTNRLRYPYEVQVTGATPTTTPLLFTAPAYKAASLNPDGSPRGLIASTANVASTAYVGANARVLGTAQILGNARVEDYAVVSGGTVRDSARVTGYALVRGGTVRDNALVTDHAIIENSAQVQNNAVVAGYARLGDSAVLRENAIARGDSYLWGSANVSGFAIADYDYSMNYSDITDGVQNNHIPFDSYFDSYYAQTQDKPRGLIASYRVTDTSGELLWDEFGSAPAILVGNPSRVTDAAFNNSQVLSLNATASQYAVLDRSLGSLADSTFGMWVNPSNTASNQTLLYFGSSATTYLKLTGRDANGFAHLTVSVNGTIKELISSAAVPLNTWTYLAVTFGGGAATFYLNGAAAGSAAMSYRPIDVLGPDTYTYNSSQAYYLGRDATGNFFTGKLEDIRFYNATLTAAEIKNEYARSGARIGQFFAAAPQVFNGTSTFFESGVHNGTTRTLVAWINPTSNAATYQAIFDAYDQRGSGNNRGSGIGLQSGIIYLRLDGVGLWNSGVAVSLNTWQQVAVTLSGTTANVYLNGVLRATRTYATSNLAMNYHIGAYQTDTAAPPARTAFFSGQMYDARIYDAVVAPTGKFDVPPTAVNDAASVPGGTPSTINVLANDTTPNPAPLTVSAVTQPAHGTVSIAAGGTAVTYTPVNGYTGSDAFSYTASDGHGGTSSATVNLSVILTLSSIVITPGSTSLNNGGSATFTAVGYDQIGHVMSPTPTFSWSILSGVGTLIPGGGSNSSATFTAGSNTELVTIQAQSGTVSTTATVSVTSALAPTFATLPSAAPNPAQTTTALSVLGADSAGEPGLTYQWTLLGTPPAAVNFSANNSNDAKSTIATFTKAGAYQFQVKATNPSGYYIAGAVTVVVNQTLGGVGFAPPAIVADNSVTQLSATAYDQFGDLLAVQPSFVWSYISGSGAVTPSGLLYAPNASGSGTFAVTVGSAGHIATINFVNEEVAWYQANASTGTTVLDSSGHNQTAILSATGSSWTSGIAGNALKLTGGNAVLPNNIVSSLSDFTISAWVKIDTLSSWSRIFDFGTGTNTNMFLTPRNGNTNVLRFAITTSGSGGEQQIDGTAALATGSWVNVAVTLAGTTGTLYVNGAPVGTNTNMTLHPSSLGATTQNYLGKSQYADPAFLGSIDDFRIYNRALSSAEILRLITPVAVSASGFFNAGNTTGILRARGEDGLGGEAGITYTWATIGTPPAPVSFSPNNSNAAKTTTPTFSKPGTYNFQVTVTSPDGQTSSTTTSLTVTTAVFGRYLFYNNSAFDTTSDNAIATDKSALLPGQTAFFANYSSYSRGINGIMIDIAGPVGALTPADFTFLMGNDNNPAAWATAPAPTSITLRPGAGDYGSTRVEIAWADNAIQNKWLQVTLKGGNGATSGLAADDVFYFGNAIAESGNSPTDARVDALDELAARASITNTAAITSLYDYNRDGQVDDTDLSLSRANITWFLSQLSLIVPPPAPQPQAAAPLIVFVTSTPAGPASAPATLPIPTSQTLAAPVSAKPHAIVSSPAPSSKPRAIPSPRPVKPAHTLEHIHLLCSVPAAGKESSAVLRGHSFQRVADGGDERVKGACCRGSQV